MSVSVSVSFSVSICVCLFHLPVFASQHNGLWTRFVHKFMRIKAQLPVDVDSALRQSLLAACKPGDLFTGLITRYSREKYYCEAFNYVVSICTCMFMAFTLIFVNSVSVRTVALHYLCVCVCVCVCVRVHVCACALKYLFFRNLLL